MREKIKTRNKKKHHLILNISLILSSIILIFAVISFIKQKIIINSLVDKSNKLIEEQNNINKKIDDLVEDLNNSNSLEYIEKKAREDLGMIKKDEKIYIDGTDESQKEDDKSNINEKNDTNDTNDIKDNNSNLSIKE